MESISESESNRYRKPIGAHTEMKKHSSINLVIAAFALCGSAQLWAGDSRGAVAGALEGLAKGISEAADRQIELNRQKELLRYQYELEAQRARQQFELEAQRIRQQQAIDEQRKREAAELERQRQIAADEAKKKTAEAEKRNAISTGTGFFIAPSGYLVTNAHVVDDYENVAVKDQTGQLLHASVIAIDKNRDLALLKVVGNFPALRIDQVGRPAKGQRVLAIGYPQVSIQGSESKVTDGVISSMSGIRNNDDWFQISVPIQGGNSGGPLINENGVVIGVVVASVNAQKFLSITGSLPQNINYAIKAKVLLSFLAEQRIRNVGNSKKKDSIDEVDRATVLVIAKHGEPLVIAEAKPIPLEITKTEMPKQRNLSKVSQQRIVAKPVDKEQSFVAGWKQDNTLRPAESQALKAQGITTDEPSVPIPVAEKKLVRIGQVASINTQYGYFVFTLDGWESAPNNVVIVSDGVSVQATAEKRVGKNVSASIAPSALNLLKVGGGVFAYQ